MRVVVLHNAVSDNPTEDERDVLVQAEAVVGGLSALGHEVLRSACTLDLASLKRQLRETRPDVVFNLVEALEGSDRMASVVPNLLDSLGIAYTGASGEALVLSNSKLIAKERLVAAGLPTPPWAVPFNISSASANLTPPYIIKAVWEHASFGMGDDAVVLDEGSRSVQDRLREWITRWGRPCFAERYV
ncbi:MAG TPA: hypothetical protein VKD72_12160, partial [Gemmataceae bacterium]|nr:hypothetical protein [Gemmataceae bacterium]